MVVDAVVPDEIIMEEILTRLAVKSVARFRCVCKSWNSQFYNPNFLSRFNHHHRSSSSISVSPELIRDDDDDYLLFMNKCYNRETGPSYGPSILSCKKLSETYLNENHNYVPYPLSLGIYGLQLVGSINGLVCMVFRFEGNYQFVLWNPIIRFSRKISMVGIDVNRCWALLCGFGWDSATNDYKLIAIPRYEDEGVWSAAVYSCKTECWSNINDAPSVSSMNSHPSVIVNGSPYWFDNYFSYILKFDTRNNEFTWLMRAPSCRHGSRFIYTNLINLNDCLAFIEYNTYHGAAKVYRYDEQHNIWMHMYTFDKYTNHDDFDVHCFKYGGEILFHGKKHRYLYDPNKSREIKSRLCRCPGCLAKSRKRMRLPNVRGHVVNGFSYTPSLVALPGMKALHM